jgi:outer membrane lipoprotein-sorting protein
MKPIVLLTIFNCLILTVLPGQEPTGEDIISRVNDLLNQPTIYSKSQMTITTSTGSTRTFESESWSKDQGEKNLIRYLAPARVKGQSTLMLNHADDIWVYFPRTQRVRKLATHAKKQKMEGSDFSYEDMGSGDAFIREFTARRLEDEKKEGYDCFKLEMTRNPGSGISYSRMIMWVVKDNYVPLVIEYYDENDSDFLLKTLTQSDIQVIDGVPTAMRMVMRNDVDNTQTSMIMSEVKYNIPLDDELFTERGLKK